MPRTARAPAIREQPLLLDFPAPPSSDNSDERIELRREIEMLLALSGAQAANFWRIAAAPAPAPPGPVPVPHPNLATRVPVTVQGACSRFDAEASPFLGD